MQAESLEVLEKASVAPAQARAIVRAIEIEIAGAATTLATKHDINRLDSGLRGEIVRIESGLRAEMHEIEARLRVEMSQLESRLRAEMGELASRLRAEIAKVGGALHAEIHRAVDSSTRQMYMALLGQMAVTLGFIYFFTQMR